MRHSLSYAKKDVTVAKRILIKINVLGLKPKKKKRLPEGRAKSAMTKQMLERFVGIFAELFGKYAFIIKSQRRPKIGLIL